MGHKLIKRVAASEVAEWCGLKVTGEDLLIESVDSFNNIADGVLCFAKELSDILIEKKSILISTEFAAKNSRCLIISNNPRLTYARILNEIDKRIGFVRASSEPLIDKTALVSPHAYIGAGVEIGPRSIIYPFVYLGDGTRIGADCIIKSGSIIGQDGFGFERDENNIPIRLIHLGSVVIGNRVEIGSLNTLCRGTLGDTIIEDDVKTDDHVHVGHNCKIKRAALITACAELSGSVEVGEFSWVGPNSSIIQKAVLGNNSFVGIGSNVTKSVAAGTTVAGNPARIIRKLR
jgi:UDP-3-O-[3-hydroxymyristoyl] glucosamine N-acyltransferase